ncbi:MAG TPA: hypothetical protein VEC37_16365 [Bacillota bacterium]|nr:hypothetical protein [Bacillota bacterium]
MKKLLVLTLSVVMVFSLAAVSMAAATVKGDFRYDMYENDEKADKSYAESDLRLNVSGDISESVSATGVFQMVQGANKSAPNPEWKMNEYYVTYKQSWGGVKAGYYEYKFTPSRVLLKSGRKHVWDKVDVMAATTVNLPVEGLSADILYQPYAQGTMDDGAYGVSLAYAGEKFGAKVTFADFMNETDLSAFDVYYNLNDTMKLFVLGVDYSENKEGTATYTKNGIDGLDPVIGFSWDKIAGSKVFAAIEYALNPRFDGEPTEYTEYTANVKYKFNNAVGLEVEHYVIGDGKTKDMVRLRYQF